MHAYVNFKKEGTIKNDPDLKLNTVTVVMAADLKVVTLRVILTGNEKTDTKITINGKPGRLADLRPGQKVSVEADGVRASVLNVSELRKKV